MTPTPPVAAALRGVHEITLVGEATPAPWAEIAGGEGLSLPAGPARLMLVAAEGRFKGLRFREVSLSLLLDPGNALLLQAFNSNAFFAWVERTFFSTPYARRRIAVGEGTVHVDGLIDLSRSGKAGPAAPESWTGWVHLPGRRKRFHAALSGPTSRVPFRTGDRCGITRDPRFPALGLLLDSGFTPVEWVLRPDAEHVKSRTVAR